MSSQTVVVLIFNKSLKLCLKCMLMLNFSNKELVQKHLVQGISWNCISGIAINILSINQFKVLNAFALRAWPTKIFSEKEWKRVILSAIFSESIFLNSECLLQNPGTISSAFSHKMNLVHWSKLSVSNASSQMYLGAFLDDVLLTTFTILPIYFSKNSLN